MDPYEDDMGGAYLELGYDYGLGSTTTAASVDKAGQQYWAWLSKARQRSRG